MTPLALRALLLLGAAWLAAVFDCGLAPLLTLREVAPSACLLAASLAIVLSRGSQAFLVAGGFGLVADLIGGQRLGPGLLCCSVIGFFLLRMRSLSTQGVLRLSMELLAAVIGISLSVAILHNLFATTRLEGGTLLHSALLAAAYTLALAWPLLLVIVTTRLPRPALTPDP